MTNEEAIKVLSSWAECNYKPTRDAACVAIAALRAQSEAEKNEPLTLEELREMDGEPVYVERPDGYKHYNGWALVDVFWKAKNVIYLVSPHGPSDTCETLLKGGGKIYRRKPEDGRH